MKLGLAPARAVVPILLALGALAGCSSSARPKTQTPNDVFAQLEQELAHTIDANNAANDPASTTMLTGAVLAELASPPALPPMQLPETRMSVPEESKLQTWGSSEQPALSEIPDTRE